MYNISLEGIVEGDIPTPRSNKILAHTDVDHPGPPFITNITCMDTGSLQVEWLRPQKNGRYVDTYRIFYAPVNQQFEVQFKTVQAIPNKDISKVGTCKARPFRTNFEYSRDSTPFDNFSHLFLS